MGDGTKENPYTREDVLRLITDHGGKAEGLDLSTKWFMRRIALNELDLKGIVLEDTHLEEVRLIGAKLEGAFLEHSHLEGSNLSGARMEHSHLISTHLEQAELFGCHLEGAELFDAHLERAHLLDVFLEGTRLSRAHLQGAYLSDANTKLESVDWGDYILGGEHEWENTKRETYRLTNAEDTYRRLKQWYTNAGIGHVAGNFFYREKETHRKRVQAELSTHHKFEDIWILFWLWIYRVLCGYGERTSWIVRWATAVIFGLAFMYFLINSMWEWSAFWRSLYYSAVSFSSLGYGGGLIKHGSM